MGVRSHPGRTLPHPERPEARATVRWDPDPDERLPIDRSKPFYPEMYPRNPDEYEPLDHFYQRQKEDQRMLERPIEGFSAVRKTIYAGELRDNGDGCGVFVYDHCGVTFYVVVGYHLKDYRIAVSGWPMLRERDRALDSGAWLPEELDTIEAFNERHFNHS